MATCSVCRDTRSDDLALIIHKQEKKIQFLETKALHLTLFYVACQLIIFIWWTSTPNAHKCSERWKVFFLSLLIAVAFGLYFATTVLKYVRTKYEQERNYMDQNENYRRMVSSEIHGRAGDCKATSVVIDLPKECVQEQEQHEPDMLSAYSHISFTACVLLGFTVLVLHTCMSSVCAHTV